MKFVVTRAVTETFPEEALDLCEITSIGESRTVFVKFAGRTAQYTVAFSLKFTVIDAVLEPTDVTFGNPCMKKGV